MQLKKKVIRGILVLLIISISATLTITQSILAANRVRIAANPNVIHVISAEAYIDKIEDNSKKEGYYLKYFNLAGTEISKVVDLKVRSKLLSRLSKYSSKVYSKEIIDVLQGMNALGKKKDIWSYKNLEENLIPKVKTATDQAYLLGELQDWGEKLVYLPEINKAVDLVNKARIDKSYIPEAEKAIVNEYKNVWSMCYLQNELNNIKASDTDTSREKVLIIGDSGTLGMGMNYVGTKGYTIVEKTWWHRLDQSIYNFSFIAVGGIGVINKGGSSDNPSERALDMLKFAEVSSGTSKQYDKVIIELSSNDAAYSSAEYKKALLELVAHIKSNYEVKEFVFINLFYHEDVMKEVADSIAGKFIDFDMTKIDKCNVEIDPWHPSVKGHQQMADIIEKYFE